MSWQRDAIGRGLESITLIAYDEAGMEEAVGSLYEAVAGIEPLTKFVLPTDASLTATQATPSAPPRTSVVWSVNLPDRVLGNSPDNGGIEALSHDGSQSSISADGKITASKPAAAAELTEAAKPAAPEANSPRSMPEKIGCSSSRLETATAWQSLIGAVRCALPDGQGQVKSEQLLPQDITSLAWLPAS